MHLCKFGLLSSSWLWHNKMEGGNMSQMSIKILIGCLGISILSVGAMISVYAQRTGTPNELDAKVENFLNEKRGHWYDSNVPYEDGKVLYNLIIKNNYTKALEIGTSTGHSAIWMAWALSKTGGKLITIESMKTGTTTL